jgi:Flp pilus assembly pilin Flp
MNKALRPLADFWHDEQGPEMVEWAILAVTVVIGSVVVLAALARDLGGPEGVFVRILERLTTPR